MFQPFFLFVAWRYLRSRRRNRFAGFVTAASVAGITLGTAALIIVLSVMNGFEREVTRHVLGMSAHAQFMALSGSLESWPEVLDAIRTNAGVANASPFVRGTGMLSWKDSVRGVAVEGITAESLAAGDAETRYIDPEKLAALTPGGRQVLLGSTLADDLGVRAGGHVTLLVPRWHDNGTPAPPRYERLTVGGLFHTGMHQYDARLLLTHMVDAQAIFELDGAVSGLRANFRNPALAPLGARRIVAQLDQRLGARLGVIDWTQYHRNFFAALESQKRIMFVILILIVAVAAFNIAANMVMTVTEKTRDIAILRTIGATRRHILSLFLLQGAGIGAVGATLGAVIGALGSTKSESVAQFIESTLGVDLINADVYFIDYLPAELQTGDLVQVVMATLVLAIAATAYPAVRAARIDPARAVHLD